MSDQHRPVRLDMFPEARHTAGRAGDADGEPWRDWRFWRAWGFQCSEAADDQHERAKRQPDPDTAQKLELAGRVLAAQSERYFNHAERLRAQQDQDRNREMTHDAAR